MTEGKHPTTTYLKLLGMGLIWGGTWPAGRVLALQVTPFAASFLRFLLASVLLLTVLRLKEGRLPPVQRHQLLPILALGLTGIFAYNAFFLGGLRLLEASRASMIMANNPIALALGSALFFRERLTPGRLAGILVSVAGALVVISRGRLSGLLHTGFGRGEFMILGCLASWVTYSMLGKRLMKDLAPLPSVAYPVVVGTLLLAGPAFAEGVLGQMPRMTASAWISLVYLGGLGTVLGYLWFFEGVQRIGPMRAGLFISFVPPSAVLFAHLLLGERLSPSLILGALLVTAGVTITNAAASRPAGTRSVQ